MNLHLHIVTLNVPYPPDYGGMIDTFHRIRSLHDMGIRIHLHCFEYGRRHSKELEELCDTTDYYPRRSLFLSQFSSQPSSVISRKNKSLLNNLVNNSYPILFDGLQSSFYINHPDLAVRKKLVRLHNIEHKYYSSLAKNESGYFKKLYFRIESEKLSLYENVLRGADRILAISEKDQEYFNHRFHNSVLLGPSHPFYEPVSRTGKGDYIIYHGDLSVRENEIVARFLITGVFSQIPYKCIIAGKHPSGAIISLASRHSNIEVFADPDDHIMKELIINAHVNILPSLTFNGFKLKLLMALFAGRHCLVNSATEVNTSLKSLLHVADSDSDLAEMIHYLMKKPFTEAMISKRAYILSKNFDNMKNAEKLVKMLF